MAKDVTSFLTWCAEPELEEKKLLGAKAMLVTGALAVTFFYLKRHRWSYLKSMKIKYPQGDSTVKK
jgi:ubiquinol-cytochrome c reductase cytochrome c1 subunit